MVQTLKLALIWKLASIWDILLVLMPLSFFFFSIHFHYVDLSDALVPGGKVLLTIFMVPCNSEFQIALPILLFIELIVTSLLWVVKGQQLVFIVLWILPLSAVFLSSIL